MKRTSEERSHQIAANAADLRPGARNEQKLAPGLYLVATPIGNARDIGLRALDVLGSCDLIAAEDTRVTSKLLAIYGIAKPLTAYNDHNGARERPRLLAKLAAGARIALVSDAGTPLVSDPGYKLVRDAVAAGLAVHAIPGPSAVLAALTLSALPTDRFLFAGFLPAKAGERKRALADLRNLKATLVFFEAPQRLVECLADIEAILGNRPAAVARELTKFYEEVRRADLRALAEAYAAQPPKGEIVIVVGPPLESGPDFAKAEKLLAACLSFMPPSTAAGIVADALELPKRDVYQRALALKDSG